MKVGLHIVNFKLPEGPGAIAPMLIDVADAAEEAGVDELSVMDHFFQLEDFAPAEDPMLEGYTTLGFLAARTETVTLGLLVTGVTYRHPGLLAKTVATLDVLSQGRAQLGIGAAWYEREHLGLGVPFPPVSERFERLEEALQICLQMWSDDNGRFDGRHYQLAETVCVPAPLRQPRPPILIGGGGEKKTLALVARYADACNLFATSPDEVSRKLDVLRAHCEREGRDFASIRKTMLAMVDPLADIDAFVEDMRAYAKLGIEQVGLMPFVDPVAYVERVGHDVVPALAEL